MTGAAQADAGTTLLATLLSNPSLLATLTATTQQASILNQLLSAPGPAQSQTPFQQTRSGRISRPPIIASPHAQLQALSNGQNDVPASGGQRPAPTGGDDIRLKDVSTGQLMKMISDRVVAGIQANGQSKTPGPKSPSGNSPSIHTKGLSPVSVANIPPQSVPHVSSSLSNGSITVLQPAAMPNSANAAINNPHQNSASTSSGHLPAHPPPRARDASTLAAQSARDSDASGPMQEVSSNLPTSPALTMEHPRKPGKRKKLSEDERLARRKERNRISGEAPSEPRS